VPERIRLDDIRGRDELFLDFVLKLLNIDPDRR
jgi:hypothetical protein